MQNLKLPITIDPFKSAQRRLVCQGTFELSEMNRLLAACVTCEQQIDVDFTFDIDELGLTVLKGQAKTKVKLICQRCTEDFEHELAIDFCFSPVKKPEAADELPSYYDAIELDENGEVNLRELVEDELILAIPLIPRHDAEDCEAEANTVWGEIPEEEAKPNPFDVLKQLK